MTNPAANSTNFGLVLYSFMGKFDLAISLVFSLILCFKGTLGDFLEK